VVRFLNGEIGTEAVALAKRDTGVMPNVSSLGFEEKEYTWYDSTGSDPRLQARAKAAVAAFLKPMGIEADLVACQEVMH
jgi:hypothetical protein